MIDPSDIELTVAQAKAVISEAKNRDIYDADMPEDGKVVEVAQEIVGFAVLAWTNDNMKGEDVRVILGLGGFEPDENDDLVQIDPDDVIPDRDPDPEPPAEKEQDSGDDDPAEAPAEPEAEAEPEPTPEPESVPADVDSGAEADGDDPEDELLEEPWEGFDKLKVAELLKMMSEFTPEQIEYVKAYEKQRNKRTGKKVRSTITDYKAPKTVEEQTEEIAENSQTQQDMNAAADAAVERDDARDERVAPKTDFDPTTGKIKGDPEPDPEPEEPKEEKHSLKGVKKHAESTGKDIEERELALLEQRKRGLPTPPDLDTDDVPEMPKDLSQCNLAEIHKLYGQFNSAYATANYALGLAIIEERAYKHIADRLAVVNWRSFDRMNPDTGKPKSQEYLRYEADTADNVFEYRQKENLAAARKVNFGKLVEIYSSNVDVLSRSLTFKEKEIE